MSMSRPVGPGQDRELEAGQLVASRFEVERLVASGGMGKVYRTRDRLSGELVAIKVLAGEEAERARFLREARVLLELKHPAIVRYVAHGETPDGCSWLAMEWLEGETLRQRTATDRLTAEETLAVARRVAEALAAAHERGVVHRDVKPSNVILVGGSVSAAKLIDFGVVRLGRHDTMRTRTGVVVGTPQYMSPEQASGRSEVDARSDVFSLGCLMFKCLTGRAPFAADDLLAVLGRLMLEEAPRVRSLRPDISPEIDAIVARLLAKNPGDRPADGAATLRELSSLRVTGPPERDRASTPARASLGEAEQSLLSVVLARADDEETSVSGSETSMSSGARLPEVVALLGARYERLPDGTILVALAGKGSATDAAAAAAHCALALRVRLPEVPIVLATGRGIVSGSTTVGDVIDRAVRLLRKATDAPVATRSSGLRPIVIDDLTGGLLDSCFDVRTGEAGLELEGVRQAGHTTRTLLGRRTPFVGRDRELGILVGLFDECVAEPVARVAVVTASAGAGKSRLRFEMLQRLDQRNVNYGLLQCRGDALSAGSPFSLLAPALRSSAAILEGEPIEVQRDKLRARVARSVTREDLRRVTEFLGELAGVEFPSASSVQLAAARRDPMLMSDQVRRAWEDFIDGECTRQPLVIVVDDLQWGDLPSVQCIDAALHRFRDRPLLVAAFARPDLDDVFPAIWKQHAVQPMPLAPLGRRASERLVREVLGSRVGDETVSRILERAAGNAFFLEELIRAVASGNGDTLPPTVLAMVQARLATLDPDARRILRAASVFGEVFWAGGVAALLEGWDGHDRSDVGTWLTLLDEHELASPRGEARFAGEKEYVFRHALVREAAYTTLTPEDRTRGHALAGSWLQQAGERDAALLADHFNRGADAERATEQYARAAEQALEANDLQSVIALSARGVELGASGERLGVLRLAEALARQWRGEWAETEVCAREALELLPAGSRRWCVAAEGAVFALGKLGRYERVDEMLELLLGVVPDDDARSSYAMALGRGSWFLVHASRFDRARAIIDRVDSVMRGLVDHDVIAAARLDTIRAGNALWAGDPESCLHLSRSAIERFHVAGDARAVCMQLAFLGDSYKELGLYERAADVFREAIVTSTRMGLEIVTALGSLNLGLALAYLGAIPEAVAAARAAVHAFAAHGDHRLRVAAHFYLARVYLIGGDGDSALREGRAAVAIQTQSPTMNALARATLAHVLLRGGEAGEAAREAIEAMRIFQEAGRIDEGESIVRLAYAEGLEAVRDYPGAMRAIEAARDRLMARATRIRDGAMRSSFLERVPHHARTVALAHAWLGR
jgi:serine/threonine protein kinase/tetratricopeptide (TPR) repeat protein